MRAPVRTEAAAINVPSVSSMRSRLIVAGSLAGFAALVIAGLIVRPSESSLDGGTNLLLVIVTGITAGGLSCLAVQGGLLATAVAQREELQIRDRLQREAALRHNAAPILWFLGAKLVAYTALGALLGGLGSLVQPNATAQGAIQLAVALFMVVTALHLLNVHPIFRFVVIQPPRFITRRIRNRAKSNDAFAPAILGAATVFLPCGVTQAMELLAIQSGSPALGAAIMFAFVLGSSPIFFLLGYFDHARRDDARALRQAGGDPDSHPRTDVVQRGDDTARNAGDFRRGQGGTGIGRRAPDAGGGRLRRDSGGADQGRGRRLLARQGEHPRR